MAIRLIKPCEVETLYTLLKDNDAEHDSFFEDWDDINNNFSEVYILIEHNNILGFFLLSEFEQGDTVWIQMMESFQQGGGTKMVNWLKSKHDLLRILSLEPSKEFWKKMGFVIIDGTSNRYKWAGSVK